MWSMNKETKCIIAFISENTILNKKNIGEGSHTVTVLEKRSSTYHKEVQEISYTQHTEKCLLPNVKIFFVVFLGCKPSGNSLI